MIFSKQKIESPAAPEYQKEKADITLTLQKQCRSCIMGSAVPAAVVIWHNIHAELRTVADLIIAFEHTIVLREPDVQFINILLHELLSSIFVVSLILGNPLNTNVVPDSHFRGHDMFHCQYQTPYTRSGFCACPSSLAASLLCSGFARSTYNAQPYNAAWLQYHDQSNTSPGAPLA